MPTDHLAYINANGLIGGKVPAGKPCPFAAECSMINNHCPTDDELKDAPYSCATARMHSLLKEEPRDSERNFTLNESANAE